MTQARPAKSPRPRNAAEPAVEPPAQGAGKPGARSPAQGAQAQAKAKKQAKGQAKGRVEAQAKERTDGLRTLGKKAGAKRADASTPPAARTAPRTKPAAGRRVQVKKSGVHGKGVYAARPIAAGETIIEYRGEIITWKEALRRHPHDPSDPNHTFYFHLDDGHVIDGKHIGNAAKWINHACAPNCEAEQDGMRVFIKALRDIEAGEELFYDYGLVIDARITPKLKREYACWCGAKTCRGTMLAGRR